jgi:anthranilate phosphoribosyltransferase
MGSSDPTAQQPTAIDGVGGWPAVLTKVVAGQELTPSEAHAAMTDILAGAATQAQIAALVTGLAAKGETAAEMTGMVQAMASAAEPLTIDEGAIDIVGTGGSAHRRRHALNVSTMACIVASAAGAVVCKHGNRRASSTSGSFDFLDALGVAVDLGSAQLEACIGEIGLGFAFARRYHPAMRFAGPVRAELGIPTVFNLLGPLANPAGVTRQVVGVADRERARVMADVLAELGSSSSWVVAGDGGLDELSTTGPSTVFAIGAGGVSELEVDPTELGLGGGSLDQLSGGTAEENVAIFRRMLDGESGPRRDIVVLNAAAGLVVASVATDIADGVALATAALDDGRAATKLERLVEVTNRLAAEPAPGN